MWPTPTQTMYKGWSEGHNRAETDARIDYTIEREARRSGMEGSLNPVWVAWLMGWSHADGWDWTSLAPAPAELMEMTWEREPPIPRVGKGIPNRVQRLRALGNGQIPQCAAAAWRLLA